jgi:hypothetical protein
MSASDQIYLVMDAGSPVTAFTDKHELTVYLRRRLDTFCNPLVYKFGGEGYSPVIMTMSRALAE